MKTWKIPVIWQMSGLIYVEANTLEEAIDVVRCDNAPLPEGDYLEGSFDVDNEIEDIREIYNNGQEDEIEE